MDFLSLNREYDSYKQYLTNSNNTMNYLFNFFTTIQKSFKDFSQNIKSSFKELFANIMSYHMNYSSSKKIIDFYRTYENYLNKLEILSNKIFKELIEPTKNISIYLNDKNLNELNKLKEIVKTTINQKKKYEICKHNYFDSCKNSENQEKIYLKSVESKLNDDTINLENQKLSQLKIISEEECLKYKKENKITNDLYFENNKKYFSIINNLKDNEEQRINFINFHFEKFFNILTEENEKINNLINSISTGNRYIKVNVENDLKIYEEKFSYSYHSNQRILKEELLLYEEYKKNIENLLKNNNLIKENLKINLPSNDYYLSKNINNENNSFKLNKNEELIFNNIFNNNPFNINKNLIVEFEKKLKLNGEFAKFIIDKMLEIYKQKIFFEFNDLNQFNRLSDFLIDVAMNQSIQKNFFELNFALIYISEKTFFIEKNNKIYLCKKLSQNYENFKNKFFWEKLIINKIQTSLELLTLKEIEKFKDKNLQFNKEIYENIYKKIERKKLFGIVKDFLMHFTNFDLDMNSANDILMEICNKYNLNNNELSYYVSYINSNMYTIKNIEIKNEKNLIKLSKKIYKTNSFKLKNLYLILNSCMTFLSLKDYINLKLLNKNYYNIIKRILFKNYFIHNNNNNFSDKNFFEKHMKMWFFQLNYIQIDYEKLLNESNVNLDSNIIESIKLDVLRTFFPENQNNFREMLLNILKCLAYKYNNISYIQGMNYICGFLLFLCKNEEKTFNIFSAILNKTDYGNIIINNFENMKKYFYVFERLISIFLPELNVVLKRNNINSNFYISPWFITLFTHGWEKSNYKIFLRIFDLFIFDGWNIVLRIGLILLKKYQNEIIKMKFEELLNYLINELKSKDDFFNDENYENFIEMYKKMKIPKGLINNLENEYLLDKKIQTIKNEE